MVCWALGSQALREAFEEDRRKSYCRGVRSVVFFDVERKSDEFGYVIAVRRQVSKRVTSLHDRPQCTEFFHKLLALIEDKMIILLSSDTARLTSNEFLIIFQRMNVRVINPVKPDLLSPLNCLLRSLHYRHILTD
ncbi:hypothetical protein EK21DRAFT_88472 [Setomelanomma holmii]|uniref:Uncharacterized protein n=1 Tax=Setomelanomma holmii TaxID=210430 RepID=A0A9P4LN76_9PLEO|nr:hypothetical protein EK21DRAFT_88472 [Setomelanomma holmii]